MLALCELSVRTRWDLILPEVSLVLEIAWGAWELWRTKVQFPPLPSHLNLRRCKFHVSQWWQIRGGPDRTTQLRLEGLRGGLIRLSCLAKVGLGLLKGTLHSCLSSSEAYCGTQSPCTASLKAWLVGDYGLFCYCLCAWETPYSNCVLLKSRVYPFLLQVLGYLYSVCVC